jgi:hypothetical protein
VFWQGVKNQPELDKWYEGTIVSITMLATGQLRHVVKYDGWPDEHVHDLVFSAHAASYCRPGLRRVRRGP